MIPEYNPLNDKHLQTFIRARSKHLKQLELEKHRKQKEIQEALHDLKRQHQKWREWIYLNSVEKELEAISPLSTHSTTPLPNIKSKYPNVTPKERSASVSPKKRRKSSPVKKRQKEKTGGKRKKRQQENGATVEDSTANTQPEEEESTVDPATNDITSPTIAVTNAQDENATLTDEDNLQNALNKFASATDKLPRMIRKIKIAQSVYPEYKERVRQRKGLSAAQAHERSLKVQKKKIAQLLEDYRSVIEESESNKEAIARLIKEAALTPTRDVVNPFGGLLEDGSPDPTTYSKKKRYKNKDYEATRQRYQNRDPNSRSLLFKRYV